MYAGIRPAGPRHPDFLSRQIGERFVEHFFNRNSVWLVLPAIVIRPVIGHSQTDPAQGIRRAVLFARIRRFPCSGIFPIHSRHIGKILPITAAATR